MKCRALKDDHKVGVPTPSNFIVSSVALRGDAGIVRGINQVWRTCAGAIRLSFQLVRKNELLRFAYTIHAEPARCKDREVVRARSLWIDLYP